MHRIPFPAEHGLSWQTSAGVLTCWGVRVWLINSVQLLQKLILHIRKHERKHEPPAWKIWIGTILGLKTSVVCKERSCIFSHWDWFVLVKFIYLGLPKKITLDSSYFFRKFMLANECCHITIQKCSRMYFYLFKRQKSLWSSSP